MLLLKITTYDAYCNIKPSLPTSEKKRANGSIFCCLTLRIAQCNLIPYKRLFFFYIFYLFFLGGGIVKFSLSVDDFSQEC